MTNTTDPGSGPGVDPDPLVLAQLLQRWAPVHPETGRPACRVAMEVPEEEPDRAAGVPTPAGIAAYGGFPAVFAEAGPAGHRHPLAVEPLPVAAAEIARLLTRALSTGPVPPDERARELLHALAGQLTGHAEHLVRIDVATEPGGVPLTDELHLFGWGGDDDGFRLSIAPEESLPPPAGGRWPDFADVLNGPWDQPYAMTEDAFRYTDLALRAGCAAGLLGEFVRFNNNACMEVSVAFARHGLHLPRHSPDDADAAFRAWWLASDRWAHLENEEYWPEAGPPFQRLDAPALSAVLSDFEAGVLGATDGLSLHLWRDLTATVTAHVTNGSGDTPLLAYAIGLPFDLTAGDLFDGFYGCLLLVGPESFGLVIIDAIF
ncbi:hypothetical protein [Streptomyces sp. NPDC053427]|uniref:hypothetical protein n=1 Tax=Streptomyces sp. NPDC053427 TaxID=3365701 RepID=UPI0037D91AE4